MAVKTVGLMADCLVVPKVVHLALSLAVMTASHWLTLKAHYWVLSLVEMMAVTLGWDVGHCETEGCSDG